MLSLQRFRNLYICERMDRKVLLVRRDRQADSSSAESRGRAMSNRTDRAIHAAIVGLALAGWLWLGMTLFTGCGFLKDGIDVMIRPGGKLHETPKVPVSPAPPQPPPPKDDWAPPFFHRPKQAEEIE
jgi:hypothetical protein